MKVGSMSLKVLFVISAIFGFISQTCAEDSNSIPTMKMLWQKEVTADANLDCSLGQITFDKINKRLLITGTSFRPKEFSDGKLWLMDVDANNGNTERILILKNIAEKKASAVMRAPSLICGLSVSDNNDVTVVGKFDRSVPLIMKINKQGNAKRSIEFINKNDKKEENILILNNINLPDNAILLIGRNGKDEGLIIKMDSEGNRLWDRSYKIGQGQVDLFINGLPLRNNNGEFMIVGCSANVNGKFPDVTGENFILICNAIGDVIKKDIFPGNPWPGEQPLVCQTKSGEYVIASGKNMAVSDIYIRGYSPDLKLLWERPAAKSKENKLGYFKIAAIPNNGFVLATKMDFGNLRVYEYDENGNQITSFSMDKEIGPGDISLACMDDKALIIYQTRPNIGQGDEISKIKIVALELK
jgi:hypothetical protein